MNFSKKTELLNSLDDSRITELENNIKRITEKLQKMEVNSFEYKYLKKKIKKANELRNQLAELVLKKQQNTKSNHSLTITAIKDFIHS